MIVYLDTETTGLYPGNICQLSMIRQTATKTTGKNFFFTVDFVEYGAFSVHGLSVEILKKLSGGKRFSDCIDEIENELNFADLVVAHNTAFDFMFLRKEFEREGRLFAPKNEFCSMKKSVPVCKIPRSRGLGYKYPKLSELCQYFCIRDCDVSRSTEKIFGNSNGFHDARFDTAALYLSANEGIKTGEFSYLKEFL